MRVLVVGSGGREHALAWKLAQSPRVEAVVAAPGSDGIATVARCLPGVAATDARGLIEAARAERVGLVVIGPEDPLALGVADALRAAGLAVFGPSAKAAQLEASKGFAREFMARHGIPHPRFARCSDLASAQREVRARGGKCVVKADGLAAGKGVAVCASEPDALAALDEMMGAQRFGAAGASVVIEDVLAGEEASYLVVTDGTRVVPFAPAQDHKRALDGDRGENTGGMGTYTPAPLVTEAVEKRVLEEIVHPTLRGMRAEGNPFSGVLYVGLMIDPSGAPSVVEFNCRFGDPETQVLMAQMEHDLLPLLDGAARGQLDDSLVARGDGAAVCVVLASGGYPREFEKGKAIRGLDAAAQVPGVVVFHAGSKRVGDTFATNGGRVLGVTARGASFAEARERAYAAADRIAFDGMHMRRDIGARALAR
ncbi:MAG: phosphoribosylamine--glycine ligase [Deltaproteobacteria bacterium]|nr:phosphoribosylamine--glycine ligase [Deltaproteobacteria bacterium]